MRLGINIIPVMPIREILDLIVFAEELGYQYCLLADEGLTADVYAVLAVAAKMTRHILLAPVTNGYTRHPATTAAAVASLQEMSLQRAFLVLVAGGSVVLDKMAIPREKPLNVLRETIAICRDLWTGEKITRHGDRHSLVNAQLELGKQDIPIWIAGRGERVLEMAGEMADGVLLMVKPDIGPALDRVNDPQHRLMRAYMDRMAYTPGMIEDSTHIFPYVLKDTPDRQLAGFLSNEEIRLIRNTIAEGGVTALSKIVTADMIKRYKIAGTKSECHESILQIERDHQIDLFIVNITTPGLQANQTMLREVKAILHGEIE